MQEIICLTEYVSSKRLCLHLLHSITSYLKYICYYTPHRIRYIYRFIHPISKLFYWAIYESRIKKYSFHLTCIMFIFFSVVVQCLKHLLHTFCMFCPCLHVWVNGVSVCPERDSPTQPSIGRTGTDNRWKCKPYKLQWFSCGLNIMTHEYPAVSLTDVGRIWTPTGFISMKS